ncbi:hypothetical protein FRC03_002084 [Tulasnella sp. 419]|nr:hypothetical protein FRC03_002084 [Tulasnella sp. 419]
MIVKQSCAEVEGELKPYFHSLWDKTGQELTEPNALSIPATLVSPITLLSSELSFLAQNVPSSTVTNIYRRVASAISNHIIQRAVAHRGRNQFTPEEGVTFAAECSLWLETSQMALNTGKGPAVRRVDLPWTGLLEAAAIVGVPAASYTGVEKAIFDGDEEIFSSMMSQLGVRNLSREAAIGYLRARVECKR